MDALLTPFLMVFLAEMGDKSQLLAMAFAARFCASQVMLGVLLATVFNLGLAVAVGTYLAGRLPMNVIGIVAGLAFILFGLWTLRGEDQREEARGLSRFGPIATVAITFSLGELGDKTQLATVALAANMRSPMLVLMGATLGMLAADGLGVMVGDFINRKVSKRLVNYVCAGVFVLFGYLSLYRSMGYSANTLKVLALLSVPVCLAALWVLRKPEKKQMEDTERRIS